jgi:Domain of unknown function (DUF2383)
MADHMNKNPSPKHPDVDRLNGLLRGERAAVEAYSRCVEKLSVRPVADQLVPIQQSHQERVLLLVTHIALLGGTPDETSGAWGDFAKLFGGAAALFGDGPALAALEKGEALGEAEYGTVQDLQPETRAFVAKELVPRQQAGLGTIGQLRKLV